MSRTAAILLAAGTGSRMQGTVDDKVLAPLAGRPVFAHSAVAFMASGIADFYVVVYRDQRQMTELAAYAPTPSALVAGGRERQDSVMNALSSLPGDIDYVFIHDCARPLIRPEQLVALHKIVRRENAVVLAHRVTDTIKEHTIMSRGKAGDSSRLRTLDRAKLWAMETPQVFSRELIVRAYAKVVSLGRRITDDAAAVELLREPVALLENPYPNPKLTTPADLAYLEFLLSR
ncbi:IspD/TarI family cytidylyltransferase [Opitutus terrae]|uniref:2-C-methyl-D-erythritol 4-phosphate cytidylyltransferase n=1 Tax=Opitutus terrae (strain DSM 11246 / JCM 15787 / PB90-1) TaxID=452637 RepID=B1ZSC3_OPITP|nr:IspD/TarI family cytidylyltransferase [Opitutus terrae]ACB75722.1 2-C-methyl-D-erythritol 4-phosphate cytidylyltransferase [Opitutus terrae PB90-1]